MHPDDRERVLAATRQAVRLDKKVSLEYRMLAADGRIHWFRDYVHPVGSSAAGPNRLRGIILDVTESRHAQEALLESEERFRSMFENATVGIYRTTPDGRILMANPALISLLGYSTFEELAHRNLEKEGFEPGYPRSDLPQAAGVARRGQGPRGHLDSAEWLGGLRERKRQGGAGG